MNPKADPSRPAGLGVDFSARRLIRLGDAPASFPRVGYPGDATKEDRSWLT